MTSMHSKRFTELVDEVRPCIVETTVPDVRRRIESGDAFHLVDVREESEWAGGRIPGSVHIGRGVLERDIEKVIPDPDAEIVLYCGGGYRSALAAESLLRMGYTRVASMQGGFRGWETAGFGTDR